MVGLNAKSFPAVLGVHMNGIGLFPLDPTMPFGE
jgi:hypothetical protein